MGASLTFPRVSLTGKTVVVTGGNTGIGYETAKWMAMMGGHVIIACRSEERACRAIEKMNEEYKEDHGTPGIIKQEKLDVHFMKLDCASLKSTTEFIETFLNKETQLHYLLLNAGIAAHEQEYTEDDYEIMFQVNYLSQFLVSVKLLPLMKSSGEDCRIVLVSSAAHNVANFNIETIQGKQYTKRNFKRIVYYGNSKIYQIMQMYSMNARLMESQVTVNSMHPGAVRTELARGYRQSKVTDILYRGLAGIGALRSPFEGAATLINAATNPEFKGSRNIYYQSCRPTIPNGTARNADYQEQLWKYTLDCLKDFIRDEDLQCFENPVS